MDKATGESGRQERELQNKEWLWYNQYMRKKNLITTQFTPLGIFVVIIGIIILLLIAALIILLILGFII